MTDKPDTLFERHPRPHTVKIFAVGAVSVVDANGRKIVPCYDTSQKAMAAYMNMINADPPKPFVEGWYWGRNVNGDEAPYHISGVEDRDRRMASGFTIGPRIYKPEF